MTTTVRRSASQSPQDLAAYRGEALAVRSVVGGALMGLANLVPGVSGGTMLLAVGIYPQFISGVAEVSTFKFRPKVVLMLACIVCAALLAIAGFSRLLADLVVHHRWIMYALFIGLTLGGVPILWRMIRPADPLVVIMSIVGIAAMASMAALAPAGDGASPDRQYAMYLLVGLIAAAAMVLPGLSGAYLLLVLGQYVTLLGAVYTFRDGLRAGEWSQVGNSLHVLIPVGMGAAIGVVGISNLMKMLLARYERATLGFLLGLLLGAVIGIWPFREAAALDAGEVVRDAYIAPTVWQAAAALGLVAIGFGISWGISHLGRKSK